MSKFYLQFGKIHQFLKKRQNPPNLTGINLRRKKKGKPRTGWPLEKKVAMKTSTATTPRKNQKVSMTISTAETPLNVQKVAVAKSTATTHLNNQEVSMVTSTALVDHSQSRGIYSSSVQTSFSDGVLSNTRK